jgi:hypothetical protein
VGRDTFIHGKHRKKTDDYKLPRDGVEPNSFIDVYYKKNGEISQRKKYDSKGEIKVDLDFLHYGVKDKHVHDYINRKRQDRRDPYKNELREMKKADKKRKWYNGK